MNNTNPESTRFPQAGTSGGTRPKPPHQIHPASLTRPPHIPHDGLFGRPTPTTTTELPPSERRLLLQSNIDSDDSDIDDPIFNYDIYDVYDVIDNATPADVAVSFSFCSLSLAYSS